MNHNDIKTLRYFLTNAIENLDAIKDNKELAANAKMFGHDDCANKFLSNESKVEDIFIKNMSSIIRYMKNNMSDVHEAHSATMHNILS